MNDPDHLAAGKWGEKLAARFLKRKGLKIVGMRIRVGARDELDIVAREGQGVVFVEVKTRKTESFGRPIAAVDRAKRHRLSRAAVRYLADQVRRPVNFRFDVVEVVGTPGDRNPLVRHIENVFTLDKPYDLPF